MFVQQTTFKFLTNLLCRNFLFFHSCIWLQKLRKVAVNEILQKAVSLILIKERLENKRKKDFLDSSELFSVAPDVIKICKPSADPHFRISSSRHSYCAELYFRNFSKRIQHRSSNQIGGSLIESEGHKKISLLNTGILSGIR